MKPELGEGITWARGHYDSIRGRIGSDWKIEDSAFDWKITIPPNSTATVFVPTKVAASVSESGQPAAEAKGVKFLRMENDRAVFEVGSGSYEFQSQL
jgi:alpha-L-rhamnosidase